MGTVSQTATTLGSPGYMWENALPGDTEAFYDEKTQVNDEDVYPSGRPPLTPQSGNSAKRNPATFPDGAAQRNSNGEPLSDTKASGLQTADSDSPQHEHKDLKARGTKGVVILGEYSVDRHDGVNGNRAEDAHYKKPSSEQAPDSDSDENSKWIHRDKLARIESEELQAAGIFLPRQRDRARSKSQNRPRRDHSQDKLASSARSIGGTEHAASRSRKNSTATTAETRSLDVASIPAWDLRLPEEILEEYDSHRAPSSSGKGSSRIPVAKISGVPIPSEHIARDTLVTRKRDHSPGEEDSIAYPKTRTRSGSTGNALAKATSTGTSPQPNRRTDTHSKKPPTAATTKKPKPANGTAGRPKTRGGPSKDSTSSGTTRPSTRSGERDFSSSSKPMEGEPPWMVSAYRPDPRLPPDQQLLPTVAKRLQQEKWEREGKFGNVYDKEFRPLTDVGFLKPPEPSASTDKEGEKEPEEEEEEEEEEGQKEEGAEWPLKTEAKSPAPPARTNSYSTMPRISDKPAAGSVPSPKNAGQTVKVPEAPEEPEQKKRGCGCCIVM
ncbi:hypothetical protein VTK26DRAFT_1753 [Humicola hyalothermophila]